MVAAVATGRDRFDMGRVVQRTIDYLKPNLVSFGLLAAVLYLAPQIIFSLVRATLLPHTVGAPPSPMSGLLGFVFFLAGLFLSCAVQAAIIRASVEGRRDSVGDMMAFGLRLGLPLLGLTILMLLGIAVGMVLLIVPGVILSIIWSMALPAVVMDGTGVFGAFSRSLELTRGSRWSIFLLFLLWGLAIIIISLIVIAPFGFGVAMAHVGGLSALTVIYSVVAAIWAMVLIIVQTAMVAAVYSELRLVREGFAPGGVSQAFD